MKEHKNTYVNRRKMKWMKRWKGVIQIEQQKKELDKERKRLQMEMATQNDAMLKRFHNENNNRMNKDELLYDQIFKDDQIKKQKL